jgi:hypothetical protein
MRELPPLSSLAMRLVHWEQQQLQLPRATWGSCERASKRSGQGLASAPARRRPNTTKTLVACIVHWQYVVCSAAAADASQPAAASRREERGLCGFLLHSFPSTADLTCWFVCTALHCPALPCPVRSFVRSLDRSIDRSDRQETINGLALLFRTNDSSSVGRLDPDTTRNGRITQAQVHAVGRLSVPSTCS